MPNDDDERIALVQEMSEILARSNDHTEICLPSPYACMECLETLLVNISKNKMTLICDHCNDIFKTNKTERLEIWKSLKAKGFVPSEL